MKFYFAILIFCYTLETCFSRVPTTEQPMSMKRAQDISAEIREVPGLEPQKVEIFEDIVNKLRDNPSSGEAIGAISRIIGLSIGCDVFNINITLPCENESHGNETPSRENNSSRRDLAKRLRIILNIESESEFEEQLENKLEKLGTQAPIGRAIKIVLLDLFHRHPKVSNYSLIVMDNLRYKTQITSPNTTIRCNMCDIFR